MASSRGLPRLKNKSQALAELATSESRYVSVIRSIRSAYLTPLNESRVLSAGELKAIFRTLTDICDVHGKLSSVITTASTDEVPSNGVAIVANELAVAKAALVELYVPYGAGHSNAIRTLQAAMQRSEVSRVVDGIAAADERVRGERLEELLAVPLDHVVELHSLTMSLVSLCTTADRGYSHLVDAADMLGKLVRDAKSSGGFVPSSEQVTDGGPGSPGTSGISSGLTAALNMAASGLLGASSDGGIASPSRPAPSVPVPNLLSGLPHASTSLTVTNASATASNTAAVVSAAMPIPPSTLSAELARAEVSTDQVLAAQAEADESVRRLEELEREIGLKNNELSLAQREVSRLESEARNRGRMDAAAAAALPPLDEALRKLQTEEAELIARMRSSEHRAIFEAFLQRKKELEAEETSLGSKLAEHEEALAQVRARLANPPPSVLPSDPAKASLYITWKRALAEREELLRQARRRKHELLRDLKARHETQVVLLELERRAAVDGLKSAVEGERAKVESYKKDLAALDESIEGARAAIKKFRQEFEQLRVALLIDRMAKSTQVANLADRRHRLAKEAEAFKEAVEQARQRVAAEESAKWEDKLRSEKEAGEKRVADERRLIDQKIEKVRQALAERYEAGFRPLLAQAEERHVAELQRVVDLQRELDSKEAELRSAHESARNLSAAVASVTNGDGSGSGIDPVSGRSLSDGKYRDPVTGDVVPDWKLREFEDLKAAVASLWEQLDVPPEEITSFLSEADLMAPFSPAVLDMYTDMYRRLTAAEALPLPAPPQQQQQQQYQQATPVPALPQPSPVQHQMHPAVSTRSPAVVAPVLQAAPAPYSTTRGPANTTASPASFVQRSVSPVAGPRAASARKSGPTPSSGGFRATGFGGKADDGSEAYLARLQKTSQLPPSLGGLGSQPIKRGTSPRRR